MRWATQNMESSMFIKNHGKLLALVLAAGLPTFASHTDAQISDGCDHINAVISPVTTAGIFSPIPRSFQTGETISAVVTAPTGGATTAELALGGTPVASAAVPGTLTYTLPADLDAEYAFSLNAGSATWELSCVQPLPPTSTTPTAVPVMPLWLLGLMAIGIAGVASIRFRRARRD